MIARGFNPWEQFKPKSPAPERGEEKELVIMAYPSLTLSGSGFEDTFVPGVKTPGYHLLPFQGTATNAFYL